MAMIAIINDRTGMKKRLRNGIFHAVRKQQVGIAIAPTISAIDAVVS